MKQLSCGKINGDYGVMVIGESLSYVCILNIFNSLIILDCYDHSK